MVGLFGRGVLVMGVFFDGCVEVCGVGVYGGGECEGILRKVGMFVGYLVMDFGEVMVGGE